MKMRKIQLLLGAILLGNAVAMRGMVTQASRASRIAAMQSSGLSTGKVQSRFKSEKPKIKSVEEEQEEEQQSWGSWFKSLFSANKEEAGEESSMEEESTSTSQLVSEEFDKNKINEIHRLFNGHVEGNMYVFDENDLSKVKNEISEMLDQNLAYKKYLLEWSKRWFYWETILDATLDQVFNNVVGGDNDGALNYIKLGEYLMNKGITIVSDKEDDYYRKYRNLMKEYKALYNRNIEDSEDKLKKVKEVFEQLDPLLLNLTSSNVKNYIDQSQRKRAHMELNEEIYRKKAEDEANREEYLEKRVDFEFEKASVTYPPKPWLTRNRIHDRLENNIFDPQILGARRDGIWKRSYEQEYQKWLSSDKDKNFEFEKMYYDDDLTDNKKYMA